MVSFSDLCIQMEIHPDIGHGSEHGVNGGGDDEAGPLLDSGEDSQAMEAIRTGMNLRKPKCGSFWDDFITVIGNADAMSDLLEVPKEKITRWSSKINELIDQVSSADAEGGTKKDKAGMMQTGNDGPVASQENQPPFNMKPDPS